MPSTFLAPAPFIELQQVESTNNYATGLVHAAMAQHGTAVFAHHQTKGKGQRYKQWHSEGGKNVALTLLLQPAGLSVSQAFLISMAVAVATHRFVSNYAGEETKIKWPNDIYWRDRKAAGILLENTLHGSEWKWCVAGVGVNINQTSFAAVATKAVSLKQITGMHREPLLLAKQLTAFIKEAFDEALSSPQSITATYKKNLYKLNETVLLKKDSRTFAALVKGVTAMGELLVETPVEESFAVGDIEWLI